MALWNTPMYRRWRGILSRCQNPRDEKWRLYGARGIYVCERWQVYENFLQDMGPQPSPQHTVGRVDNDGPYSPENCRWETPRQQANNTRTNRLVGGATMAEQARRLGIQPETVAYRIRVGLDPLMVDKLRKKNCYRTILQKDSGGSVVQEHASLAEASRLFENSEAALKCIWRVLQGQRHTYRGYCWEYGPPETSESRTTNHGPSSTS